MVRGSNNPLKIKDHKSGFSDKVPLLFLFVLLNLLTNFLNMDTDNKHKNQPLNKENASQKNRDHQDRTSHADKGSHPVAGGRSQNVESIEDMEEDLDKEQDSDSKKK